MFRIQAQFDCEIQPNQTNESKMAIIRIRMVLFRMARVCVCVSVWILHTCIIYMYSHVYYV